MKRRPTFWFSLGLNLALVGVAAQLLRKPPAEPGSGVPIAAMNRDPAGSFSAATEAEFACQDSAPVTFVTNRFEWRRIESEDFEQFAANLRAIGCPEQTVHDVVVARARRALKRLVNRAGPPVSFWTAGECRERANREAELAALAAGKEIIASVERVIGSGQFVEDPEMTDDFVGQAILRFVAGPMSEATFSRLTFAFAHHELQRSEIKSRARGVLLDEDEAALADCHRQLLRELAGALTPAELEEFIARSSMMGLADKVLFAATDLTVAEIRQLALLRGQVRDPLGEDFIFGGSPSDEEQEQFYALIRQQFGESRLAQIERAMDDDFQALFRLGRENNLPREAAANAFELRQLAAQEVARLREDRLLSAVERQQALAIMQAQTQAAILDVLGAEACAQYLNRGGSWLTNLSGL